MKTLLLILCCLLALAGNSQNGFTTYTTNLTINGPVNRQSSLVVDNSGNKWIGFSIPPNGGNVGLVKYDNTSWTLYNTASSPALPSNNVKALAKDNSGNIWIGTDAGLVKFNGTNMTTYNTSDGLISNGVTCLESIGSVLYVGTNNGLSVFDGLNFTNFNVAGGKLPNDSISCIKAETSGIIWLGGNKKLVKLSIDPTLTVTSYTNNVINQNTGVINCIYIDAQNKKWLGTSNVGVVMYAGASFVNANTMYTMFGGVIPDKVYDIDKGFKGGVILKMVNVPSSTISTGLLELASAGMVHQYFSPVTTPVFKMGDYIERDGAMAVVSQGAPYLVYTAPKMYYSFDTSVYRFPLGAVSNANFKTLDINQVNAGITNKGDMHWDIGGTNDASYEVPKGSGKHSNYISALWIAGMDNSNQLYGSPQTYSQNTHAFWPGPLDTTTALTDITLSSAYDKIWKVSNSDINAFITNFNNGNVQNNTFTPIEDILTWPAKGTGNCSRNLAPFVDVNNNGIYDPLTAGDYPKIKGEQTLYFIFNDNLYPTNGTGCSPMGVEVHAMAYAYGCPEVVSGLPVLDYTTFYDYKIINRSSVNYHDVTVAMWSEVDLGYYGDDYIGSNVQGNYAYAYNGDGYDETAGSIKGYGQYPPAQGFAVLKGPLANTNDGIDNDNDGLIDEPGEECKMNRAVYYNDYLPSVSPTQINPQFCQDYYGYLNGMWLDGSPFTCGGSAYGGTTPAKWVYTGDPNNSGVNTDPNNNCGYWTEMSAGNTPGDRRILLTSGTFNLAAGEMKEVEYAFVTSFDSSSTTNTNLLPLMKLNTDIQRVNAFYKSTTQPSCPLVSIITGIKTISGADDVVLYPNPAKALLSVKTAFAENTAISYEIMDILGKVTSGGKPHQANFNIDVADLKPGIYFLRITINDAAVVKKFVKE